MLKNYMLVTLRSLKKNGTYSFINISGLSIGIASSLLIMLWVFDELSFDKFLPKATRLYQVRLNAAFDGKINNWTSVPQPTYEALKTEDNSIKNTAITDWGGEYLLTVGENRVNKRTYFVSEEFLEMFEFPLIKGDPATVLDDPNSIVISESTAKIMFGEKDPMNQVIRFNNATDLKVTGILRDVPKNSSFQFDFLVTWKMKLQTEDWVKRSVDKWDNYSFQVFVELDDATNLPQAERAIKDLMTRKGQTDIKRELLLQPMLRWRLHTNYVNGKESGGMIDYVNMFTIIAMFVLIIACINFMNLATARSERRAREVGIRKSVGSRRHELILQFMGESLFLSVLAFVIGVLMVQLLLPLYNDLVDKQLFIEYQKPLFWIFALCLISFTGLVSGSYPALYLSSFEAVKVLKGKVQVGKSASLPRKVLVTLQFGFSILMIIGTIIIYWQIRHVKGRELGYEQENLITVEYTAEVGKNYKTIKQELLATGVISSVTKSNSPITEIWSNNFMGWPGKPEEQKVIFSTIATEFDYTKTMGIKILQGRDFSEEYKSDSLAIVVNKAALDVMGLKNPLGEKLDLWGSKRELIGIVDNVLMGSPYQPVKPMFMILQPEWASAVTIRLNKTNDLQASIHKVEEIFKKYNPSFPFECTFADVQFAKKFTTINMTSNLASVFASLAIVITGLGLFGLAAFMAEQRTKEIGIRKVMGATVSSLVALMSKDFSKLVLIALVISSPLAWWLLNSYLERFPYRIEIPWWVFPLTGVVALVFATAIVSTQALRAAVANPANSLRNE